MYSAPLSLQTAETKWYRVTGSWATPLKTKQNSGKLENFGLRPADQFLSQLLYDCTSPLPTSGTQTFNSHKTEASGTGKHKGVHRTHNTSRFFQESPVFSTAWAAQHHPRPRPSSLARLSFAASAAALMPAQAAITLTEILLLSCCHTLLNNLRLIWFYQRADLIFDPCAK